MVFRVIDNNLTSIFNKTQTVSKGFNFASDSLNSFIKGFNRLNSEQNFGKRWDVFLKGTDALDTRLVTYFQDLAQQGASARANIQGVYATIIDGNTRGYGNVKSLISTFNQIDPANQKAFAQAVGQTNSRLGTYLVNLDGAKASMSGYTTTLAGATAKTVALQVASLALNTALTMGVSLAISGLITLIGKCINAQKEAIEKAKETSDEFANQENSLRNLREEYLKIVDSTESVSDKNKELIEWKKKLVQQYEFEEEALKKVNSERETGIALIDEEIRKSARATIAELGDTFSEAQHYMETNWVGNLQHGFANSFSFDDETLDKLKEFNIEYEKTYEIGGGGRKIKAFFGDDLKTSMRNLEDALTYYRQLNKPTDQQKDLTEQLQKQYDSLKEIYDEYSDIYSRGLSANAIELFYQYTDKNAIKNVTEETYQIWRDGLLEMAGESDPLRKSLAKLADETFPQFSESINESTSTIKSNGVPAVKSLADTYEELGDKIKEVLDLQDKLTSAFEKVAKGESLSAKELLELINEFPELAKYINKTDKGYSISEEGILEVSKANRESVLKEIQNNIDDNQQIIDKYNDLVSKQNQYAEKVTSEDNPIKALADFNGKMQAEYGLGNVDLTNRPKVSADKMSKYDPSIEEGTSTVYSAYDFFWEGKEGEEDGRQVIIHYTPILPDGTVFDSEEDLKNYIWELCETGDVLANDTKGIILKIDEIDASEADVNNFLQNGEVSSALMADMAKADEWDEALHNVQEEWLNLSNAAVNYQNNVSNNIGVVSGFRQLENLSAVENEISNIESDYNAAVESNESLRLELDALNSLFDEHSIKLEGIKSKYETAKKEIDSYNKTIQTIDKAIQSMNEGQALTYDEMVALIEISPALKSAMTERSDGYYFEIEALNNLKKASRDERNSYIEDRKAEVIEQIRSTRVIIAQLSRINSVYDYMQNKNRLDNAFEQLKFLQDTLALYDSLFGELYNNDTSSGLSSSKADQLQDEIDYYDTIIKAIEAVTDKKIEAIDKEIEGLEKQKDALEEANDERERELDLIEARNNLDKAKKQTVFVYEEGKGFVEKADERAIADAQKNYDDVVNQIAIDDIDKQIEEREALKESFEDYKGQFTDLKSDVEDIVAIEQAKFALGTDEEGLLNLSDDQKQQITSGLAGAIIAKDNEDNKDNSKHKALTLDDVLKRYGATVTADTIPTSFKQSVSTASADKMLSSIDGQNKTMTNVTYNNGSTQVSTVFNINGKLSVDDVAKAVNDEMKKVLQQFVNSVKQ